MASFPLLKQCHVQILDFLTASKTPLLLQLPFLETFLLLLQLFFSVAASNQQSFTYNGFHNSNLNLEGASYIQPNGILTITNDSTRLIGHAYHPFPLQFKKNSLSSNNSRHSFSTTFVFTISPKYPDLGGHGLAFFLSPYKSLPNPSRYQYLGLPNFTLTTDGLPTRLLAVEFDIVQNDDVFDINDNHVGIDINSLISNVSAPAFYYGSGESEKSLMNLKNINGVQAWVEYSHGEKRINVTIAPFGVVKPRKPLLSLPVDISLIVDDLGYVGFSAATGLISANHEVYGWSFQLDGRANDLAHSELPRLKRTPNIVRSSGFVIGITITSFTLVFVVFMGAMHIWKRERNSETIEDWERECGARRFTYTELSAATNGFRERDMIGIGGFGRVYRGVLPSSGLDVAIKRLSGDSMQGEREFIAEVTSVGRLRHRNLIQLHGWCKRKGELLLVYDYVSNGSLDNLLFDNKDTVLPWETRYQILIGAAKGLLYLHEECEQRVVHRDVKASNILIDSDLNPKLGDFGLARTYVHGVNSSTTRIVGTLGYLAPELTRTGKATTSTDVFGFGAVMLEVACGRRPIEPEKCNRELVLVDWIRELHCRGTLLEAADPKLDVFEPEGMELVLKIGLLCSHPLPGYRPSMRRVVQFLLGEATLPELPPDVHLEHPSLVAEFSDGFVSSDPSSSQVTSSKSTSSFSSVDKVGSSAPSTRSTF
ncbi:L-type lectin-domain containing receptor kinase IV.2 [Amborella trichopoda]|uniref:L-type lectin-domain containing receptor kinase IV.2 n=1 Tax=Amborella trichopoda TaxID=13333 RepID=UPI0005D336EA|nr:L-type lectin-domain containing receptor kinase IV.2 [Amborella trichopoda]|eukprot:XP_011622567.1 L-type lectin-domain containing receptor kinase IV.2 [Amborella trichopoda]